MKFLFPISLLLATLVAEAQTFTVPENYRMESAADFARYEPDILQAVDWLLETPVGNQPFKRQQVSAFFMTWLTGTPSVTITLYDKVLTFSDCGACIVAYMGGWSRYVLQTGDEDALNGNMAGIETVLDFYLLNQTALGKVRALEKYRKKQAKDKLKKYLRSKM